MKLDFQEHHRGLLNAIEALQATGSSDMEKIESSFKVSLEYWSRLQKHIRIQGFRSQQDEISFFSNGQTGIYILHRILYIQISCAAVQAR